MIAIQNTITCYLVILLSWVIACQAKESPRQVPGEEVLRVGLSTDPQNLDPRLATRSEQAKICELIFDGLFQYDENLKLKPNLVKDFRQGSPLEYFFELKPGVTFHDGRPLTSRDVRYTLASMGEPKSFSPFRSVFEKIQTIETPNLLSLRIRLREPFAPFLSSLTLGIVPEPLGEQFPENFGKNPIGSGPFRFVSWEADQKIRLKTNDHYHDRKPLIVNLEFRIVRDDTVRVLEFLQGNLDIVQNEIPPLLIGTILQRRPQTKFLEKQGINYVYLAMHVKHAPLQDLRVRKAIAYALDRQSLLHYKMKDLGEPASGLLSPIHWAYEGQVTRYGYDPDKAKDLLDEAGYLDPDGDGPKKRFSLRFKSSTAKSSRQLVKIMARSLEDVGIGVNLESHEAGVFARDLEQGNFDLFVRTWTGATEPDIFHYLFHSQNTPPTGANRGHYANQKIDELLEQGRTTLNPDYRKKIYSEVQKILADDLPYISLWHEKNYALLSPRVLDYTLDARASFLGIRSCRVEK